MFSGARWVIVTGRSVANRRLITKELEKIMCQSYYGNHEKGINNDDEK